MTHLAVYTLPFTLQLCYKTLGILTSVTKSQKVHISSHNVLQKSHTCEEGGAHMRIVFYGIYWWNLKKPKNQNFCKNEKKKKTLEISSTLQKTKILKKWKKHLEMSSFQTCATKNTIKWCMLTQIWSAKDIIFCHFRPFFALLPHYWPRKLNFRKNVQNTWRYYPFTPCAS